MPGLDRNAKHVGVGLLSNVMMLRREPLMERSTWILMLTIPAMVVAIFLVRRQKQTRGIGLFGAVCPRCAEPLPSVRKATSFSETLWGGWTCPRCGCKVDRYGKERNW